jgi:hypothetical protein
MCGGNKKLSDHAVPFNFTASTQVPGAATTRPSELQTSAMALQPGYKYGTLQTKLQQKN